MSNSDDRYGSLSNEIQYAEDDMLYRVFGRMERLGFSQEDGLEALDQLTSFSVWR